MLTGIKHFRTLAQVPELQKSTRQVGAKTRTYRSNYEYG